MISSLPEFDAKAEAAVLNCLMTGSPDTIDEAIAALPDGGATFYDNRHAIIFDTIVAMRNDSKLVEPVTVLNKLGTDGTTKKAGGFEYISTTILGNESVPSNFAYYCEIVREKMVMRRLRQSLLKLQSGLMEAGGMSIDATVSVFEQEGRRMREMISKKTEDVNRFEALDSWMKEIGNKDQPLGMFTGFSKLDSIVRGFRPGELIVIGGRTGTGKTTLAWNIGNNLAKRGVPVGAFSMEMKAKELLGRILASDTGINTNDIEDGAITDAQNIELTAAIRRHLKTPLHLSDKPALRVEEIAITARRWVKDHGIRILLIDYLQLIASSGHSDNTAESLNHITRTLKVLSMELNIPVLILSQLNRGNEKEDRQPRLSDLRGSGGIEEDANMVLLLYPDPRDKSTTHLLVAKNRRGQPTAIKLLFNRRVNRFEELNDTIPHDADK